MTSTVHSKGGGSRLRPKTAPEEPRGRYGGRPVEYQEGLFPFLKERNRVLHPPATRVLAKCPYKRARRKPQSQRRPFTAGIQKKPSFGRKTTARPRTCTATRETKKSSTDQKTKICLAKWSMPIYMDEKKERESKKNGKRRSMTAKTSRSGGDPKALRRKESILSQEVIGLVTQRMLAEQAIPLYNATSSTLGLSLKKDPNEYLSAEKYMEFRKEQAEQKEKEKKRNHGQNELTKKFDMSDVRTHGSIFRPFVAHEQLWLMRWGSSKGCDMRANCHIFRSLEQWDKMKRLARVEYKLKRKERAQANSLAYRRSRRNARV